jgi:hypothetical protein
MAMGADRHLRGRHGQRADGHADVSGKFAAARGQAFGRGLATLLAVMAGVVLIIMHFVNRKRR